MSESVTERSPSLDTLYDVPEAARRLGVTERWVRRAVAEWRKPVETIRLAS